MGFFDGFTDFLKGSVGNNMDNDPADVRNTKRNLNNFGFFDDEVENDFITRKLDTSIKEFQQDNDLRVDGRLFPSGETERELFSTLEKPNPVSEDDGQSIGFGGNISGVIEPQEQSSRDKVDPLALRDDAAQEDKQPEGKFVQTASGIRVNPEAILQKLVQEQANNIDNDNIESSGDSNNDKLEQSNPRPAQFDATGRMIREEQNIPVPERKPLDSPFRPPILQNVENSDIIEFTKKEEGKKNYLYKDTASNGGKVTIGVGRMLDNAEEAKTLPFMVSDPDAPNISRRATDKEIEQAFNKVDVIKQPADRTKAYGAHAFDPKNSKFAKKQGLDDLWLEEKAIDWILEEDLKEHAFYLRKKFPDLDTFSPNRQKALLDMMFNLGPGNFTESKIVIDPKTREAKEKGWPKLFEHIRNKNWEAVAKESKRGNSGNISDERNERTKKLLLDSKSK